jgi:hypothetical protein
MSRTHIFEEQPVLAVDRWEHKLRLANPKTTVVKIVTELTQKDWNRME